MEEENLEPLITECPHCQTRFRVTDHQLRLAAGRVRCGACLTVFQGVEHLVWDEPPEFQSEEEAQDALDALLDELGGETSSTARTGHESSGEGLEAAQETDDESRAVALDGAQASGAWLSSDNKLYGGHEGPTGITLEEHHWPGAKAIGDVGGHRGGDDDGNVDENIAAKAPAEAAAAMTQEAAAAAVPPVASAATATTAPPFPAEQAGESRAAPGPASVGDTVDTPVIPAGTTEEADFAFGEPGKRRWWVPVAMVVAVLTLCTQVLWYQFDRWSVDPEIRPLYAAICQLLGCELPVMRSVEAMVAKNLVVRSHPTVAGALVVNAVIVNEAEFAQPFPILELKFTELSGGLVAGRQFQPEEYLAGEMLGAQMVASKVPVHVELAIEDPGEAAVNYYLNFR